MLNNVNFKSGFGQLIKDGRRKSGRTLAELSGATSLDVGTISRVENGVVNPAFVSAVKLMDALDITLDMVAVEVYQIDKRNATSAEAESNLWHSETPMPIFMTQISRAFDKSRQQSVEWLTNHMNKIQLSQNLGLNHVYPQFQVAEIVRFMEPTDLYTYNFHANPLRIMEMIKDMYFLGSFIEISDAQLFAQDFVERSLEYVSLDRSQKELLNHLIDGSIDRIKFDAIWKLSEETKLDFVHIYRCALRNEQVCSAKSRFAKLALKTWYWLKEDEQKQMLSSIPLIDNKAHRPWKADLD